MGKEQHGELEWKACVTLSKCDTWVDFAPSNRRIICLEDELVPLLVGASRRTSLALFAEIRNFDSERR